MSSFLAHTHVDLGNEVRLEDVIFYHCTFTGPATLVADRTGDCHSRIQDSEFWNPGAERPAWHVGVLGCEFLSCRFERVWVVV